MDTDWEGIWQHIALQSKHYSGHHKITQKNGDPRILDKNRSGESNVDGRFQVQVHGTELGGDKWSVACILLAATKCKSQKRTLQAGNRLYHTWFSCATMLANASRKLGRFTSWSSFTSLADLQSSSHRQNMTSAANVTPQKNILKSLQFSTYRAHKIFVSVVIVAWPWPLVHDLEDLFNNAHSYSEYLWQVLLKFLHWVQRYCVTQNIATC